MIIGLTGGIGSGKSAAADFFIDLGINVLDADQVAKDALLKNSSGFKLFIKEFGNFYLDTNGEVDRIKLRQDIFSDKDKKSILESIIHPIVLKTVMNFIKDSKSPYTIIMVPLLFETDTKDHYDKIICIDCLPEEQLSRAMLRDNQNEVQIKNIINNQASREQRISIAHDVIENNSTLNDLKQEVKNLHEKYLGIISYE
tara:strand:- start:427 stop:1023 length:597 start_codon:yes stop_codon:yes gene_type:complete